MKRSELINKLAKAIARQEGFFAMKGLGWDGNNPGNLRDVRLPSGAWWIWPVLEHTSGGFPKFPTLSDGFAALERDLGLKIERGMTLKQLITAWAPPVENQTDVYIKNVATWTEIDPGVPLKSLIA